MDLDFGEIVEALDPNDPINNQSSSMDIGVECTSNERYPTLNTNHSSNTNPISNTNQQTNNHNKNVSTFVANRINRNSIKHKQSKSPDTSIDSSSTSSDIKKPNERDLTAINNLINKLKHRKQENLYRVSELMRSKANGNIFTIHETEEPTLQCPWCGDNKGYRYITKHLHQKCSARDMNMNQSTLMGMRKTRKRSTRNIVDYKQFMDNDHDDDDDGDAIIDHDDEETEDEYPPPKYDRRSNRTRVRKNHSSPHKRSKRKR